LTPRGGSGVAAEGGIFERRIGVYRYEQDIVTVIKDILCAVAVMVIHIENRNPFSAIVCKSLCRDGRVVEIAIAGRHPARSVMPRWTAQREDQ